VEHHAADELHVVVPHAEKPPAPLPADRERLDEDVVESLAGGEPPAELGRLAAELRVAHRLVLGLEGVDGLDLRLEPPQVAGVGGSEQAGDEPLDAAAGGGGAVGERVPDAFESFHGSGSVVPTVAGP